MTNLIEFEGKWNLIIAKLRQRFKMLTEDDLLLDDDLLLLEGREYALLNRLQIKLGKTTDEICKLFRELLGSKSGSELHPELQEELHFDPL